MDNLEKRSRRDSQFIVRQNNTQVFSYMPPHKTKEPEVKQDRASAVIDGVASVYRLILFMLASFLTAALIFQSYPKRSVSILAWVALVPFLACYKKTKTLLGAGFYGLFTGFVVYAALLYWIYYTCRAGGLPPQMSLGALAGLCFIMSFQFAIFALLCFYARKTNYLFPLIAAAGWVTLEFAHETIAYNFLGFPWFMMGYSQWNQPVFLQTASFGGVFAISFALVFVNAAFASMFTLKSFAERALPALMAAFMFFAVFMFGKQRLDDPILFTRSLKISVLQPDIDQYKKWDSAFVQEIENILTEQIDTAAPFAPDIILWPETALPGPAQTEKYMNWLRRIAQTTQAYQLVGSTMETEDANFVSAYLFNRNGDLTSVYNKQVLVPFGEYVPFEENLSNFNIPVLGTLGSFTPGDRNQPLQQMDNLKFATMICYESIFPQLWNSADSKGEKIFFNLTNDGWFLNTSAPYQHFAANVVRAVEFGKPVVRSANNGISGWIDPLGRIKEASKLGERTVMNLTVPVNENFTQTIYSKYGDVFAYLCITFFLTAAFTAFVISNE
ncbi:MAG: apolipoprotein N-acyltransferase [Elusimicrobium sp.]|jgi:apolipoprotein N-acyltransferase|nr:apolipoprotein N-acyltransferase [Elusimicrobium sp.]